MNRSPCGIGCGPPSGPNAGPRSRCSSLHGPHGPVSPICQKLSLSPSRWMRSIGTPTASCQICSASSSLSWTVIQMPVAVEAEHLGGELPGPRDGLGLEVVAEAPVAEHLEEHEVASGAPDVVEVVVLAAGAHALLRVGRPLERWRLVADEVRLERHHARHGEQHGGVVRDQARRRHDACGRARRRSRGTTGGAGRRCAGCVRVQHRADASDERQPRSGQQRPAWPGNAMNGHTADQPTALVHRGLYVGARWPRTCTSGSASRIRTSSGPGCSTPRSCGRTTAASTAPAARACSTRRPPSSHRGAAATAPTSSTTTTWPTWSRRRPPATRQMAVPRQGEAKGFRSNPARTAAPTTDPLVDDACIFLNRPGFAGGVGCALHIAATRRGRASARLEARTCAGSCRCGSSTRPTTTATSPRRLREWKRRDWGEGGAEFHWWCTESPEAFVGTTPVYDPP